MGQAQKEVFVNEAHALVDALLHCAVEAEDSTPPASPADGENWLVGAAPTGAWAGHSGELACRQAGNWIFVAPRDGMRVFDRVRQQFLLYSSGWQVPSTPAQPTGGTVIDVEARAAIAGLETALRDAGIIAGT